MTTRTARLIFVLWIGLLLIHSATAAQTVTLELSSGDVACENVIVETVLPSALADDDQIELIRMVSRYRFYVHDGPLDMHIANQLWQQYSYSPKVQIAKVGE